MVPRTSAQSRHEPFVSRDQSGLIDLFKSQQELTMTAIGTTDTGLQWDVLTIKRPGLTRELPPGKEQLMWVANSSTLIYGERDAILVDTFLTTEQIKT